MHLSSFGRNLVPWDQIAPLALFSLLLIILIFNMRRRLEAESRRPELARKLCAELGFTFIAGNEARLRNQGTAAMDLAALDRLPTSLKASLLEDSSWRGEGEFDAVRVAVYDDIRPSGNHFRTFLVVRAYFPIEAQGSGRPGKNRGSTRRIIIDDSGARWEKANAPLDLSSVRETLRLVTAARPVNLAARHASP